MFRMRQFTAVWVVLPLLVAGGHGRSALAAGPLVVPDPAALSCSFVISSVATRVAALGITEEQRPQPPTLSPGKPGAHIPPPTDREVRDLAVVLGAISESRKSPAVLAALARGEPFSFERFAVLVGDTRSILAGIHASELLGEIGDAPNLPPDTKAWFEGQLGHMIECPVMRFRGRGDASAFERTRELVLKYRRLLDPLIFTDVFGTGLENAGTTATAKEKAQ